MTARALQFQRDHRLTKKAEFDSVLGQPGVRVRRGALRLYAVPNTMRSARLGLIVAKRVVRDANQRNRTKRVLREAFRRVRPDLPSADIVIQATSQTSNAELVAALEWLWPCLSTLAK